MPLVALKNTIYLGVLLLTFRTRHFPLSYEGVPKLAIEVVHHAQRMYCRASQFILGQLDKFKIMFSSCVWFRPRPTGYWHNGYRYTRSDFCALLALTILLILWIFVWFQWPIPSQHVLRMRTFQVVQSMLGRNRRLKSHKNSQNE